VIGLGTIINVVAIFMGAAIGSLIGHKFSPALRTLTTDVLGLITAVSAALSVSVITSTNLLDDIGSTWPIFVVLFSLLIGGFLGSLLQIESRLELLGESLKRRMSTSESNFVIGFVTASLVFCIGPLAIMGAFDDAMGLGIDKLVLKSTLDFFASIAFAASFGWGVAFSALSVGAYQAIFTAVGFALGNVWDEVQVSALTVVGGLLLFGISLKLLNIRHIAIGNLIPALFLAPYAVVIARFFS
jgi:uncharacterized membrane protein YqgA involved in biofilm formation